MARVAVACLAGAVLLTLLTGCASRSAQAVRAPIVQDLTALRDAADAGAGDEAVAAVDAVLARARSLPDDREGWRGTALLRARLPQIMKRFLSDYPHTRDRLERVHARTRGGAAVKTWLLRSYATERRLLLRLSAAVSSSAYAWGAVLEWDGANNAAIAGSSEQLVAIARGLPAAERRDVVSVMAPRR